MQADSMSRFFAITVTDNGAAWTPPDGAAWTVRFGAPGMPAGWYDTITEPGGGTHPAVVVDENTATVEIAEQAVSTPGNNVLCVLVTDAQGYQIASWPFALNVQGVPGFDAPEATVYYNALTAQVAQVLANAQTAAASATLAESWAVGGTGTRDGEDTNNSHYWAEQAQQVSQGALGWYESESALQSARPTGQNGQWAIIGSTDTIWTWDSDTSAWVDSGSQMDLSQYYTKSEANETFGTISQVQAAQSAASTAQSAAEAATSRTFTADLPASGWTGSDDAGYTQTVDCEGMTADVVTLQPMILPTGDRATDIAAREALGYISMVETLAGQVTVTCWEDKPTVNLTIYLVEAR